VKRLAVLAVAMFAALAANAQQRDAPKPSGPPTVGIVTMGPQSVFRELPTYARFYVRMRELGWRAGENIRFVERGVAGDLAGLERAMKELVRDRVALIVAVGTQESLAAKRATDTIPVVMVHPSDPVEMRIVESYGRPGGNVTGNMATPLTLAGKRIEILAELLPSARRIVLGYDSSSANPVSEAALSDAAAKRGLAFTRAEFPDSGDYDAWVTKVRSEGADVALITHSASTFRPVRRKALAEALLKHRLPSLCYVGDYVESGCLASYSASIVALYANAADYADRILRGAKPAHLPIQQPAIFELVINKRTAALLGISIPAVMLLRADRMID
jgi:putative ABC transport system substrate-binding protein